MEINYNKKNSDTLGKFSCAPNSLLCHRTEGYKLLCNITSR